MNKQFKTPKGFVMEQEDIDGILANAFEGGSNYWLDEIKPDSYPEGATFGSDVLSRGSNINLMYEDGVDVLTIDKLLKGIDLFREKHVGYNDSEEMAVDADSDNVLQYAIFGQLVYG